MKKRILSFILVAIISLGTVVGNSLNVSAAPDIISGIYRCSLKDGEIQIKMCLEPVSGELVIPSTIEGYPVTSIGYAAFTSCKDLVSVVFPDSIKSIEGCFSWLQNLESVQFGSGLETIGEYSFTNCRKLTSVVFPESLTYIGENAFQGCESIKSINLNKNMEIDKLAFGRCNGLTQVTIPEGTKLGVEAFAYCENLTGIDVHPSVTEIDASTFYETGWVMNHPDGPVYINNMLYDYKGTAPEDEILEIRPGTTRILGLGFQLINGVSIPESVEYIGENCFEYTMYLKDVYYHGSESDWNNIYIEPSNSYLTYATKHFLKYSNEINGSGGGTSGNLAGTGGNSLGISDNSFSSFQTGSDTLKGPGITILGKTFHLFELPINMSVKSPLGSIKYNADKEKYEIIVGYLDKTAIDGINGKNKTYHEIKEFVNFCGKSTTTETWNKYQRIRKILKEDSMNFGFKFNATPAGYMELDKNGKLLEGSIVYILNMSASLSQPIPAAPIVYVKVGLDVDATGKFGIKYIETNEYSIFGSLGLDVAPYVGAGVGNSKVASAEVGAKLKISSNLELVKNKQLSDIFSASIAGQLYLKVNVLAFINFNKNWDIAKVSLYPNFGASLMTVVGEQDDMVVMPRDYAQNESVFCANNNLSLSNLENLDVSTFKTNVYPYAEPQLVKLADGRELLVWIDNDNARGDINCTVLKYSVNDGTSWSQPMDIYNNGTADFAPKLATTDNGAVLVWQKANSVLSNSTTLSEMAKKMDIYYSAFDGTSWTTPENLTNTSGTYEFAPDIAVCGDEITAVWMTNSTNDCFAYTGTNKIHKIELGASRTSATVVKENLGCVASLCVSYIDGKASVAYTEDRDGNVETSDDIELFEIYDGGTTQITFDNIFDTGLSKTSDGYYWIHGSQLWERNKDGVELIDIPLSPMYLGNAKILSNATERVIVYEQTDAYSSDLYAMCYDESDNSWGSPVRLTEDNKKIRETNGYLTSDGALRLAFGQADVDETKDDIYGECNLMIANITEMSDIQAISADCAYDDYVPGEEATIYVTVKNNSFSKVSKLKVEVCSGDETVLSQNIDEQLMSGETKILEIPYTLSSDLTHKTFTVTVTPSEKTDDNPNNNCASFEMGFSDITLDATVNANSIEAKISNEGYESAENVVCTLSLPDGTVVEEKNLGIIEPGSSVTHVFANVNEESVVVTVSTDSKENLYGNNTESVIMKQGESKGVHIAFGEYEADKETVRVSATVANDTNVTSDDVNAYVAFYKQGKLVSIKPTFAKLSGNSSFVIEDELSTSVNADTAKVFLWKGNISPYEKPMVFDIEYPKD